MVWSRNPVFQGLMRRCSTHPSQDKGGVSNFWGQSHVSQPPWNFQRRTVVDHTLDTRSIAATYFGEEEGSTTGVRGVSTTSPTLLLPFLQEVLRSHTKQVFSGDPADFAEWRKAWESFVEAAMAASGGQGIPDNAMLRVWEGWLDKATKGSMRNKIKENTALRHSDFFLELCREFQVE